MSDMIFFQKLKTNTKLNTRQFLTQVSSIHARKSATRILLREGLENGKPL